MDAKIWYLNKINTQAFPCKKYLLEIQMAKKHMTKMLTISSNKGNAN
jgi:hypothetical protein